MAQIASNYILPRSSLFIIFNHQIMRIQLSTSTLLFKDNGHLQPMSRIQKSNTNRS